MYTIVIQLGAILCLPIYFRSRIAKFLSTFPQGERGDRHPFDAFPLGLTLVAFVVTAVSLVFLLTKSDWQAIWRVFRLWVRPLLVGGHCNVDRRCDEFTR